MHGIGLPFGNCTLESKSCRSSISFLINLSVWQKINSSNLFPFNNRIKCGAACYIENDKSSNRFFVVYSGHVAESLLACHLNAFLLLFCIKSEKKFIESNLQYPTAEDELLCCYPSLTLSMQNLDCTTFFFGIKNLKLHKNVKRRMCLPTPMVAR